jgi:hypothetical protein
MPEPQALLETIARLAQTEANGINAWCIDAFRREAR